MEGAGQTLSVLQEPWTRGMEKAQPIKKTARKGRRVIRGKRKQGLGIREEETMK